MKKVQSLKRRCLSLLVSLGLTACSLSAPPPQDYGKLVFEDSFEGEGPLEGYTVNNADVLKITTKDGRYYAPIFDNTDDKTLHFNGAQGRLDAKLVSFPFTVVARNIGIGTVKDTQKMPPHSQHTYIFAGIQVHTKELEDRTSAHVVVGHRGGHFNTVEGKQTINGNSFVNDIGVNKATEGRADLLIQGLPDKSLKVFWQPANTTGAKDRWIPYFGHGDLPGQTPAFSDEVYVGLITYGAGQKGLPFAGTADSFELFQK